MSHYQFEDLQPKIDPSAFVAPGAIVIGDVTIGAESSVWYNVVLRGDVFPIRIGARTNLQDLSIGHVTSGTHALTIGDDVTVGHRTIVHGCTIQDRCLIGMGAVIMDAAVIGTESLIGAGAVITPRTEIPPRSLVLGSPGKVSRELTEAELEFLPKSADNYVQLAKRHQKSLQLLR